MELGYINLDASVKVEFEYFLTLKEAAQVFFEHFPHLPGFFQRKWALIVGCFKNEVEG